MKNSGAGAAGEELAELGRHTKLGEHSLPVLKPFLILSRRWILGKLWDGQPGKQRPILQTRQRRLKRGKKWVAHGHKGHPNTQEEPGWGMVTRRRDQNRGRQGGGRLSKGEPGPSTLLECSVS